MHPWVGIGAVLMQQAQPIADFSQALPPSKCNSSAYERELLAIILSVRKWRHYLFFQPFIICTDQHSLKYLLEQGEVQGDYHRLLSKLMGYRFTIQYKAGHHNQAADALSRLPETEAPQLTTITVREWEGAAEIKK